MTDQLHPGESITSINQPVIAELAQLYCEIVQKREAGTWFAEIHSDIAQLLQVIAKLCIHQDISCSNSIQILPEENLVTYIIRMAVRSEEFLDANYEIDILSWIDQDINAINRMLAAIDYLVMDKLQAA